MLNIVLNIPYSYYLHKTVENGSLDTGLQENPTIYHNFKFMLTYFNMERMDFKKCGHIK